MEEENYCKRCNKITNKGYYVNNFYFCGYRCKNSFFSEMYSVNSSLESTNFENCSKILLEIDKKLDEIKKSLRFLDKGVN